MIKDLTKEMTESKTAEKLAQEDYEEAMKDAADKRATDTKTLADKEKAKADTDPQTKEACSEERRTRFALLQRDSPS